MRAQKYRAWEHHPALTVLASGFVAQTKFEWAQDYPRDPALLSSLAEVRQVLWEQGVRLDVKGVRRVAYRRRGKLRWPHETHSFLKTLLSPAL